MRASPGLSPRSPSVSGSKSGWVAATLSVADAGTRRSVNDPSCAVRAVGGGTRIVRTSGSHACTLAPATGRRCSSTTRPERAAAGRRRTSTGLPAASARATGRTAVTYRGAVEDSRKSPDGAGFSVNEPSAPARVQNRSLPARTSTTARGTGLRVTASTTRPVKPCAGARTRRSSSSSGRGSATPVASRTPRSPPSARTVTRPGPKAATRNRPAASVSELARNSRPSTRTAAPATGVPSAATTIPTIGSAGLRTAETSDRPPRTPTTLTVVKPGFETSRSFPLSAAPSMEKRPSGPVRTESGPVGWSTSASATGRPAASATRPDRGMPFRAVTSPTSSTSVGSYRPPTHDDARPGPA